MSFNIEIATEAATDVKHLSKQYRSFKADFGELISTLEENPIQGEPLGKDCFKLRLAIRSKQKRKVVVHE